MEYPNIFQIDISHDEAITEFRSTVTDDISSIMSDDDCLRFLRARGGSVIRASQMAGAWNEWRHKNFNPLPPRNMEFTPNTLLASPDYIENHPSIELLPISHFGSDKEGRPIYWERTGYIQSRFPEVFAAFTVDELIQYHIQSNEMFEVRLEYLSKLHKRPITNTIVIFDMKYLMMTLNIQSIAYVKDMLGVDQAYYPERLYKLFMINCPWYFTALFNIFRPFIDKRTASKFNIIGTDFLPSLLEYIDESNIPVEYGGTANMQWGGKDDPATGATHDEVEKFLRSKYGGDHLTSVLSREEVLQLEKCFQLQGKPGIATPEQLQLITAVSPLTAPISATSGTVSGTADTVPADLRATSPPPPVTLMITGRDDMRLLKSINVKIIRAEETPSYHVYVLSVQHKHGYTWQVKRRFSDFVYFRSLIRKIYYKTNQRKLPDMPKKVLLFKKSKSVVAKRIVELDTFLNQFITFFLSLQMVQYEAEGIICEFLEVEENTCDLDDNLDDITVNSFSTLGTDGAPYDADSSYRNSRRVQDVPFHSQIVPLNQGGKNAAAAVFTMCVMILSIVMGNLYQLVEQQQ